MKKNQLLINSNIKKCVFAIIIVFILGLSASLKAQYFKGVNWSDQTNNYKTDAYVVPAGLSTSYDYNQCYNQAKALGEHWKNMGLNIVRVPINPHTVLNSWWDSYQGAIHALTDLGMTVIICPWSTHADNGYVEDPTAQQNMWDRVLGYFGTNTRVKFEIFNEPNKFTLQGWIDYSKSWITRYRIESPQYGLINERIILDGWGWASWVATLGDAISSDPTFDNVRFGYHCYYWWGDAPGMPIWENAHGNRQPTPGDWSTYMQYQVGNYTSRTIVTEFGAPMTPGVNYGGAWAGDNVKTYMYGCPNEINNSNYFGAVAWNGVGEEPQSSNSFGLEVYRTGNDVGTLYVPNLSGLDRVKVAWGFLPPLLYSATTSSILTPETTTAKAVSAYPNPATSLLNLSLPNISDKSVTVNIRSIAGNLVHSEKLAIVSGKNTYPITLGKLATGSYFVTVAGGSFTKTIKIEVR